MRIVIKGADFSNVSIGKVIKDLSFVVSGSTTYVPTGGISGFPNWNGTSIVGVRAYNIDVNNSTVFLGSTYAQRLQTDFIEVCEGMTVEAAYCKVPNSSSIVIPAIVCFDANKELLTNSELYSVYWAAGTTGNKQIDFTIPAGVKYIKIQSMTSDNQTATNINVFEGNMPEEA